MKLRFRRQKKVLLATNPAFWPWTGGSEMILERILLGVRDMFEEVVVFTNSVEEKTEHNSITVMPYSPEALQKYAKQYAPTIYFPNMVHSALTFENIEEVSKHSRRTIVNLIGGYAADTPLEQRAEYLNKVEKFSDCAVHVDAMSTEYLVDRAINPRINYHFISQGLDFNQLQPYRRLVGKSDRSYYIHAHNLWSWKRPELFIEELVAKIPKQRFMLIANDKTGDVIDETVKISKPFKNLEVNLGLDRARFLEALAGASAIVSTSSIEGAQPNILLEAGYLGIPYLTLCPNQNFGHYPHVEMFYDLKDMRQRLSHGAEKILKDKENELTRARGFFSSPRFDWDEIIKEYRELFGAKK